MSGALTRLCLLRFIIELSDASLQSSQIVNENAALRPIEGKFLLDPSGLLLWIEIRQVQEVVPTYGKSALFHLL